MKARHHAESRMVRMALVGKLRALGRSGPLCGLDPTQPLRQVHRAPLAVDRVEHGQVAQSVHQRYPSAVLGPMISLIRETLRCPNPEPESTTSMVTCSSLMLTMTS